MVTGISDLGSHVVIESGIVGKVTRLQSQDCKMILIFKGFLQDWYIPVYQQTGSITCFFAMRYAIHQRIQN